MEETQTVETQTPPGNGAVPEELLAPAADEGGAEADRRDFEARLRTDPEFAVEQFKKQQSAFTKAQQELQQVRGKVKTLEPWIDSLGGAEQVLHHLGRLGAIQQNARMRQIVEEWERTGSVPVGAATAPTDAATDDQFLDPMEREVRDLRRELEDKIARLEESQSRTQATTARSNIKTFIDAAFAQHPYATAELRSEVLGELEQNIAKWDRDEAGRQFLSRLSQEDIAKFVNSQLWSTPERQKANARRLLQMEAEAKRATATSAAAPVQTNGREVSTAAKNATDAIRDAMREVGVSSLAELRRR